MDNKAITKKVAEQSLKINQKLLKKFASIDHKDVIRDLEKHPDKLELFQLQCLSLGTMCEESAGPAMGVIADAFCIAAARAAQLVSVVKAADDVVKGN